MFGFFRRKKPASQPSQADITTEALRTMGFQLSAYGVGTVVASNMSGYSPHETASMVALMTIARDVREAGSDIFVLMLIATHATEVIKMLHAFKTQGLMREEIWANDVNALKNIVYVEAQSAEWIEKVLSGDPIAGKERLATRTVAV